ncbi:uncharacterized protein LOC124293538 [Neodiprion lecontei]|uniref:Uncharacterized protein LOC124293538 n=1 Tax=Neodiprion lecontei TaxID=441921 RepID=A0ABM3FRF8_NEOLC|nr:uncharacterized protein LOC124293538 [Neodiprion lecontei]
MENQQTKIPALMTLRLTRPTTTTTQTKKKKKHHYYKHQDRPHTHTNTDATAHTRRRPDEPYYRHPPHTESHTETLTNTHNDDHTHKYTLRTKAMPEMQRAGPGHQIHRTHTNMHTN